MASYPETRLAHRLVPETISQSIELRSAIRNLQAAEDVLQDYSGAVQLKAEAVRRTQAELRAFLTSPPQSDAIPSWALEEKLLHLQSEAKKAFREEQDAHSGWSNAISARSNQAGQVLKLVEKEEKAINPAWKEVRKDVKKSWRDFFGASSVVIPGGQTGTPAMSDDGADDAAGEKKTWKDSLPNWSALNLNSATGSSSEAVTGSSSTAALIDSAPVAPVPALEEKKDKEELMD